MVSADHASQIDYGFLEEDEEALIASATPNGDESTAFEPTVKSYSELSHEFTQACHKSGKRSG